MAKHLYNDVTETGSIKLYEEEDGGLVLYVTHGGFDFTMPIPDPFIMAVIRHVADLAKKNQEMP